MRLLLGSKPFEVKVAQSCLTLCDPMDYTVHRILQAATLPRGSSQPRDQTQVSRIADGFFTVRAPRGAHIYLCSIAQSCLSLCSPMDCSSLSSSVHGNSPGKKTGVGCHSLLQGIFPTQGSNPHWQAGSLPAEPPGKPKP